LAELRAVCGSAAAAAILVALSASAVEAPAAVSPGEVDDFSLAAAAPTFSWGAVTGAHELELVIFAIGEGAAGGGEAPVVFVRLPGAASSWTPPADGALVPGGSYAWSIRAVGDDPGKESGASDWATPRLFRVPPAGSPAVVRELRELAAAAAGGRLSSQPAAAAPVAREERESAASGAAPAVARRLPAALLTADSVGLRAEGGSGVGIRGVTHSPDGAGVVGANLGNGPDIVLSGKPDDPLDGTRIRSDAPGDLVLESQAGVEVRLAGGALELTDSGASLLFIDAAGNMDAFDFTGDGQLVTGVGAIDLVCSNCVTGSQVEDGGITSANVVDGSVGSADFGPSSITGVDILDGSLTTAELVPGALTAADLADGSVGASEIGTGVVGSAHIAAGAVGGSELASGSVRGPDLVGPSSEVTVWHSELEIIRLFVECDGECTDSTLGDVCSARGQVGPEPTDYFAVDYRPVLVACADIAAFNLALGTSACGGDNICQLRTFSRTSSLAEFCFDTFDVTDAAVSCLHD
jgi:hypothetical protein